MSGTANFWIANFGQLPAEPVPATAPRPGPHRNLLGVGSDQEAVQLYLRARRFTPARAQVFLTELARFTWFLAKEGVANLNEVDLATVERYDLWLAKPSTNQSTADVGPRASLFTATGRFNVDWRPFKPSESVLSGATIETNLSLIRAFYTWLVEGKYCAGNPFKLLKPRGRSDGAVPGDVATDDNYLKALSLDALVAIGDYLKSPDYKGSENQRAADRWLVHLLYETGHRVFAARSLTIRHLVPVSQGIVELRVVGKRSKSLKQEWTPQLQQGLLRYRATLGLNWPPAPGETEYLYCGVHDRRCREKGVSKTQLYRTLQRLGKDVATWVTEVCPSRLHQRDIDKLRGLGPHTFRHTAVSLRVNVLQEGLLSVRDHMGHTSIQTTESYLEPVRLGEDPIDPDVARAMLRDAFLPPQAPNQSSYVGVPGIFPPKRQKPCQRPISVACRALVLTRNWHITVNRCHQVLNIRRFTALCEQILSLQIDVLPCHR